MVKIARKPVVVAISLSAIFLCLSIVLIHSRNPIDRRVSNVALSSSGRWLAAGTAEGNITVWDQMRLDDPRDFAFPHGHLNDLQFSPDEHTLAIASRDLGAYDLTQSSPPRLLRSDHENYGTVRFTRNGETLLVITAAEFIEILDARSGAKRLKICCSTVYGEVAFSPDEQTIANAGHWPSLWAAGSGRLIAHLTENREFPTFRPIAFDAIRNTVFMGSQDGRVYSWDLTTTRQTSVSPAQPDYVDVLTVSANGWVIFAAFGKEIQLWNPDTGQRRSLPAARPTSNLILSPGGASIMFGTAEGAIESWDLRTEQLLRSIRLPRV